MRTRKWTFVAQEARRLADLGLSPPEIARRLKVNRSTVQRWMAAGHLANTRRPGRARRAHEDSRPHATPVASDGPQPTAWAAAVRQTFTLDATDAQLVELAVVALTVAQDAGEPAPVRLNAMGRFQSMVKQLALVARTVPETPPPATPPRPARTPRPDPRGRLMVQ